MTEPDEAPVGFINPVRLDQAGRRWAFGGVLAPPSWAWTEKRATMAEPDEEPVGFIGPVWLDQVGRRWAFGGVLVALVGVDGEAGDDD